MPEAPTLVTLSKYPPYVSGHASQALWNNEALVDLLARPVHQLTYTGAVPGWAQRPGVRVHPVATAAGHNPKAIDGHLTTALAAAATTLARREPGLGAALALYADPHANALLRARTALRAVGHSWRVAVSVEGSDLTDSVETGLATGTAAVLLAELLAADEVLTVSVFVRDRLLSATEAALGGAAAEHMARRVRVRLPGLPPAMFRAPQPAEVRAWRAARGIPQVARVISTLVRLVPEKGADLLLDLADMAADAAPEAAVARVAAMTPHADDAPLHFVIAGTGPQADRLQAAAAERPNVTVLPDPGPDAPLLRACTQVALLPSRSTARWVETFGIAALEYQALGVPVLTPAAAGFLESTPGPRHRLPVDAGVRDWWLALQTALRERAGRSAEARAFAGGFTSARSAALLAQVLRLH